MQKELDEETAKQKKIIKKLLEENLHDLDSRQFEYLKRDENLMEEWAKNLVETIWIDYKDSPILPIITELLKLTDKELYLRAREKKITLRQFKTRCMERLNNNQFPFIDYDDIVHLIAPGAQNLDLKKLEKWTMAAFGKKVTEMKVEGPDSFLKRMEDWQVEPRCLRSIANFRMTKWLTKPSEIYRNGRKARSLSYYRDWDF